MKIVYAYTYNRNSSDALREMMPEFFWCRMEEVVLIVACSAPLLKSPVGHALKKMGFPSFQDKTRDLNSFHPEEFEPPRGRQAAQTCASIGVVPPRPTGMEYDEEKGKETGNQSSVASSTLDGRSGLLAETRSTEHSASCTLGD